MVFDEEPSIDMPLTEQDFHDLDLWSHDIQNLNSPWPECVKYLCMFWLKSLRWFTSIRFTGFL